MMCGLFADSLFSLQACARYEGKFDWIALGDDDTVFMYNRIGAFLSHIDHTQVPRLTVIGTVVVTCATTPGLHAGTDLGHLESVISYDVRGCAMFVQPG